MAELLLLHGPNLNLLGQRDPEHYGSLSLPQLEAQVRAWAADRGHLVHAFQSNHEGALIDQLQQARAWAAGALVNLGALTHTSYALHDALVDFARPAVEVHLSKISEREPWRRVSVIRPACIGAVEGRGVAGYLEALEMLIEALEPGDSGSGRAG